MRDCERDPATGHPVAKEWVEAKGKPVSCSTGVNSDGLERAAEEVARWVQTELHACGDEPLDVHDAIALWELRLGYLNALYWLHGHGNGNYGWKRVEARAAPGGQPLAICVGSNQKIKVPVMLHGKQRIVVMHGYRGCLRTFPVGPYGRGRPWARWCNRCRSRKTNAKQRAISELQRRSRTSL